jgi:hypothetical protein
MKRLIVSTLSALSLGFPFAQTAPPASENAPNINPQQPEPSALLFTDFRNAEKAAENIEKASRKAYKVEYLVRGQQLSGVTFLETAQTLLREAQNDFIAQKYFAAREKAKAAEKLYDATEELYEAQFVSDRPQGRGPGGPQGDRPPLDTIAEAQEELYILERELEYYRSDDNRVLELQTIARDLLEQSTRTDYTYAKAAEEVAKAARHLIAVDRGF